MEDKEINLKLKACKTAEELKTVAKEIGYELTDEEADAYFKHFSTSGELSDDELGNVTGGCTKWRKGKAYSGDSPHYLIVTIGNSSCPSYYLSKFADPADVRRYNNRCPSCGHCVGGPGFTIYCNERVYDDDKYNPN